MKKILIILITLCTFNAFAQIPTNGLVAHYPFNGNANDISGNANNGTVNGATLTTDRFGSANSAYNFDGKGNYISYQAIGITGNSPRTVVGWVKRSLSDTNSFCNIISSGTCIDPPNTTNIGKAFNICIGSGKLWVMGGWYDYYPTKGITINKGQWQFLVVTYDGSSNLKTYIDGVLDNSSSTTNRNTIESINYKTSGTNNYIGKSNHLVFPSFFNGIIDDIRIYNRALSQNEVTTLYNEGQCVNNVTVTDTLKIGRITGVNALPDNFGLVKVYPNPTKDVLNISATNPSASYTIQFTNNIGTVLYSNSLLNNNLQVNLNTLGANGLYFIKILDVSNNVLDTRKLVLE